MVSDRSQTRATFNDTKKAQEELRKYLDELETENRPIKDNKERTKLFDLIANSTLGIGVKECHILLPDHKKIRIPNFEQFIRILLYHKESTLNPDFFYYIIGKTNNYNCDIDIAWRQLKYILFGIFPEALSMSMRISKEQTYYRGMAEATSYHEL